jgi:rhodanese-related sulfurtransferase
MTDPLRPRRYADLIALARSRVAEIKPWDLAARLKQPGPAPLLLDVREPAEFAAVRIAGAFNVPRGVLEQACEWDYDETEPALAAGRDQAIVVICRSGNRSLLAAEVLQQLGFTDVRSLATGMRGWNDFDQPVVDGAGQPVDGDEAERRLAAKVRADQRKPAG